MEQEGIILLFPNGIPKSVDDENLENTVLLNFFLCLHCGTKQS